MRKDWSFHLEYMKFTAKKRMEKHPSWAAYIDLGEFMFKCIQLSQ